MRCAWRFRHSEQKIGAFNLDRDWESCMTFTGFWSWHGFQTTVIPYEECLGRLVRCAGGNGNLLMKVGPMPTGQIDPREVDRLQRVGSWLDNNGESIYGTRGGPYKPGPDFVSTRKGETVYLHFLKWTGPSATLPPLPRTVLKASLISGAPVQVDQTGTALRVTLSAQPVQAGDTVVKLQLDGPVSDIDPIEVR